MISSIFPAMLLATLVCVSFTGIVEGQDYDVKKCKSTIAALTKRQLGLISSCTKSMKFKNGKEKSAKHNCIMKCVMMEAKLLDPKYMLTQDRVEKFIQEEFEGDFLQKKIQALFQPCVDDHGPNLDPEEEYCKSYEPVIKCVMAKLPGACVS